uniref:Uncharacterized protein MANES_14G086600 n=1 Tax=Rhizophora mucronata TaxID=61149 RepID=A0A2P2Q0C8_RHIMU
MNKGQTLKLQEITNQNVLVPVTN